jgi:hypothetical protein
MPGLGLSPSLPELGKGLRWWLRYHLFRGTGVMIWKSHRILQFRTLSFIPAPFVTRIHTRYPQLILSTTP